MATSRQFFAGVLAILGLGGSAGAALSAGKAAKVASMASVAGDGFSMSARAIRFYDDGLLAGSHVDDVKDFGSLSKVKSAEQHEPDFVETWPGKGLKAIAEECATDCTPPDIYEPTDEERARARRFLAMQAQLEAQKAQAASDLAKEVEERRRMDMLIENIEALRAIQRSRYN